MVGFDRRAVICGDVTYEQESGAWYICTLDPHGADKAHYHLLVERYLRQREPNTPPPVMLGTLPPLSEGTGPVGSPERQERLRRGGGDFQPERPAEREPPPTGQPLPAGVEGHSVGSWARGEGASMDAGQLIAAIDAVRVQLDERRAMARAIIEGLDRDTQSVMGLSGMANMPAHVHTTAAHLQQTAHHLETEVMNGLGAAIEELETWKGQIVQ